MYNLALLTAWKRLSIWDIVGRGMVMFELHWWQTQRRQALIPQLSG